MKKKLYMLGGFISLGLGYIGVLLPFIPTVPFLLLAAICFGNSSEKLDAWFKSTKIYKNNLETYVKGEGMTLKTKIKIISMVTLLMGFGFYMMSGTIPGRIVISIVWILHVLYFGFRVKTIKEEK